MPKLVVLIVLLTLSTACGVLQPHGNSANDDDPSIVGKRYATGASRHLMLSLEFLSETQLRTRASGLGIPGDRAIAYQRDGREISFNEQTFVFNESYTQLEETNPRIGYPPRIMTERGFWDVLDLLGGQTYLCPGGSVRDSIASARTYDEDFEVSFPFSAQYASGDDVFVVGQMASGSVNVWDWADGIFGVHTPAIGASHYTLDFFQVSPDLSQLTIQTSGQTCPLSE